MKARILSALLALSIIFGMISCTDTQPEVTPELKLDQVSNTLLQQIRLGDGVPLDIQVNIRWEIQNFDSFSSQFAGVDIYDSLILAPRGREIVSNVANLYTSVDSIFTSQRKEFIKQVKDSLRLQLGEPGIVVKEVMLSDVIFPRSFTDAMEKIGMKEKELELIRQQSIINQEKAIASEKQAEADGKVAMAQAKMEAEVEKINATTEESRRKNKMAKAETESQIKELNAKARKRELELLAEADLKKQQDLKDLAVQRQKEMDAVALDKILKSDQMELDKIAQMDDMDFARQQELATLYSQNPVYASFLVNQELAKQVEIAILPADMNGNVFSDLLKQDMTLSR